MQQTVLRPQFDVATSCSPTWSQCDVVRVLPISIVLLVMTCQTVAAGAQPDGLLDFTATWCGPCQQMSSIVSRLERQGAPIRKVDIDQEPELARRFGVQSIPCFILVSNGQEIDRITGLTTEKQLVGMLNRLPKASGNDQAIARTSDDGLGPSLGQPVPLTPRQAAPEKNASFGSPFGIAPPPREVKLADASDAPLIRGQNPDEVSDLARAAVRIRVKDGGAVNFGSGTIVDSRPGQSIVLTCGHIFRKLTDDAVVEIDLYYEPKAVKPETVIARLMHTDLNADVGVVTFMFPRRLPTARIASSDKSLAKQDRLISIGCSGGDEPSRENHQLTAINKYDGPDNLECTGLPQQGRSGGGLFRGNELVGVCIAADPKQNRGIYAGLKAITVILDKVGLERLCPRSPSVPSAPSFNSPYDNKIDSLDLTAASSSLPAASNLEEINRMLERELNVGCEIPPDLAGAEVVCIVRSKNPAVPSRVIIVNQASDRFVADLLHESIGQAGLRPSNTAARGEKPNLAPSGPIETSFEPKPYRRSGSK